MNCGKHSVDGASPEVFRGSNGTFRKPYECIQVVWTPADHSKNFPEEEVLWVKFSPHFGLQYLAVGHRLPRLKPFDAEVSHARQLTSRPADRYCGVQHLLSREARRAMMPGGLFSLRLGKLRANVHGESSLGRERCHSVYGDICTKEVSMSGAQKRQRRKRRLFQLGKVAISRWARCELDFYVCPLCFSRVTDIGLLSWEDVPQKSIGGKELCLTCKTCNEIAGHEFDAHVLSERQNRAYLREIGSRYPSKFQVGEKSFRLNITKTEQGTHIDFPPELNNPAHQDFIKEELGRRIRAGEPITFTYDIVPPSRRLADIGYLKSAYLAAFAMFGYTYIIQDQLEIVREQIRNPATLVIDTVRTYVHGGVPSTERRLSLMEEPVRAILVQFGDNYVFLPLDNDSATLYEFLSSGKQSQTRSTFRGNVSYRWPDQCFFRWDFTSKDVSND
ncbi:hypothetical protein AYO47_06560 [Planctomyces sp. SCGC AG-212-M04]|nr:hypothetical protein AYO47_06560 [Planctomyces sp. SCGC AG-212-M04]